MKEKLMELLSIKKEAIWIKTSQEKEIIPTIINVLLEADIEDIYTWSVLKTVEHVKLNKTTDDYTKEPLQEKITSPVAFLELYNSLQKSEDINTCAFIFRDYDDCIEINHMYKRMIKEITEQKNDKYIPMIFISNKFDMPSDLAETFSLLEVVPPNESEIIKLLNEYEAYRNVSIDNKEEIAKQLKGFYFREIIELIDLSFYRFNKIDLSLLKDKKIELINKTNLLKYESPNVSMEDIGGNKRFKKWYEELKYCFNSDIKQYGVEAPKGYLALGIPGSSKSLGAKAIAYDLKVPFLELDMSKLLSCKVGESEQRVSRAIELIESCAPCVLLIDEIEKNLGGVNSSNQSDSGVVARIFGKILQMLNDNDKGIFCVMTSNNVQELPPELTRAGRLDAIWYFTLPTAKEREEILDIHFRKRGYEINKNILHRIAKLTKSYTGAELEQIAKISIQKEYVNKVKDNLDSIKIKESTIKKAVEDVIPISKSSKEKISALENWAKNRALYANETEILDIDKVLDEDLRLDEII